VRPHLGPRSCPQKRSSLLDSLAKAIFLTAQLRERAQVLAGGTATVEILEAMDARIALARRDLAEALQLYLDHCKEHS
jgi:hypothetical protein